MQNKTIIKVMGIVLTAGILGFVSQNMSYNNYVLATVISDSFVSDNTEESLSSLNYTVYANPELGITFEYPSNWNLEEKTNRFTNDPDVMVSDGFNDFKFLDHKGAIDNMLDYFDLEFIAVTMQNRALEGESDPRLIESASEVDNEQIDGIDGSVFTFLYTASNPYFEGMSNLKDIGEIARQIFLVENDGKVYTLVYSNFASDFDDPESQEIMNHILTTFKFNVDGSTNESEEENEDENDNSD